MRSQLVIATMLLACGPQVPVADGDTGIATTEPPNESSTDSSDDDDDANDTVVIDYDIGGVPEPKPCNPDAPCLVDILVVIDNSATMGDAQAALTRALVQLVGRFEQFDTEQSRTFDVQMMFTTTDMGNELCDPFYPYDYEPAMGSPIASGCLDRLNRFGARDEVCQDMCTPNLAPLDPFVAFLGATSSNVPGGLVEDIDHDGDFDSMVGQTVACLAPQGFDGCGYESPLESMLQALNPDAAWNEGERPFLRDDSDVIIVIATDETDCSMDGSEVALDPTYWEPQPGSESPAPSSALCWNAGMTCGEPDRNGVYTDCTTNDTALMPVSRYVEYLDFLAEDEDRGVFVVAVDGVPEGGVEALVLHDWRADDLFRQEVEDGVAVEDMTFDFKIGPGCTDFDREVRGLPNPRLNEVCASANIPTVPEFDGTQCCIESICAGETRLDCIDDFLDVLVDGHTGFG